MPLLLIICALSTLTWLGRTGVPQDVTLFVDIRSMGCEEFQTNGNQVLISCPKVPQLSQTATCSKQVAAPLYSTVDR